MNSSKMKYLQEWFIKAPWGNIALASCGDPRGDPVLLVHGRQDSMSTFLPLLKYLPARYYYVAMDLPGNGHSDNFPIGITLTRLLPVSAINVVIEHLKWNSFVYIGHSMGAELGLFYNTLYPGKISRLILLDVNPGLQRLLIRDCPQYFKNFYEEYYSNYANYNIDDRIYTKEKAVQAVMRARGMSREQAEIILARNLKHIGDNKFKLSWDKRQKILAPSNFPPEFYMEIFSKNMPPSLYVNAKQSYGKFYSQGKDAVDRIIAHFQSNVKNLYIVEVEGGHDVHFTHPERLQNGLCAFLNRNFENKSKL